MNLLKKPQQLSETELAKNIRDFILQKDYPCIAAIHSLHKTDYRIGIYQDFVSGESNTTLREHLRLFLNEQLESGSEYLSFWATYEGEQSFSEEEFETRLWQELSCLTSLEQKEADWGPYNSDPQDPRFSFCLFGEPFFVVGLHAESSRKSRKFSHPTLIFNIFRQFESLQKKGIYDLMVRTNRIRDLKFDGAINPMAEKFGEKWESIQFSGRKNSETWKCPFRFLHKK